MPEVKKAVWGRKSVCWLDLYRWSFTIFIVWFKDTWFLLGKKSYSNSKTIIVSHKIKVYVTEEKTQIIIIIISHKMEVYVTEEIQIQTV